MYFNTSPRIQYTLTGFLLLILLSGCSKPEPESWTDFIPDQSLFVIITDDGTDINRFLQKPYVPVMDDMTPTAMQLVTTVSDQANSAIDLKAVIIYPDGANDWQPVWITEHSPQLYNLLANQYQREYQQNRYDFLGYKVQKLFLNDRVMYMLQLGDWFAYSESSLALESMIRSLTDPEKRMKLPSTVPPVESVLMNTSALDTWMMQLASVSYRPHLHDLFEGLEPVRLEIQPGNENMEWRMLGTIPLTGDRSNVVESISNEPEIFDLERFIPLDAAHFSIYSTPQSVSLLNDSIPEPTQLDSVILQERNIWHTIDQNLSDETAFVSFSNSGPSSASEYLFLRSLRNPRVILPVLEELAERELLIKDDSTYFADSYLLGKLLGGDLFPTRDFYVTIYDDAAALSQRKGLAESVGGDAERRRVVYYDDGYSDMRSALPQRLSSLHYLDTSSFSDFIQPWLSPQHYADVLLQPLDKLMVTTRTLPDSQAVRFEITAFQEEEETVPYSEQWVFPVGGSEITGPPVLADLTGSERKEVIFTTTNGTVYVLASDGTIILQASTNEDVPVGSPIVYDWYGNNEEVILQAAGNKIYAWSQNGVMLPSFPVLLDEMVVTPIHVNDITENGVAEILLATADRSIHILNTRGQPVQGWPQMVNSVPNDKPVVAEIDGQKSVFVFSENALHAWDIDGERRAGFPVFLPTQIDGSPYSATNHLLGSGLDGNLYSVGLRSLFADSLASSITSDSLLIQSIQVSNSSLNSTPSVYEVMVEESGAFSDRRVILTQAANGSVFLYETNGELHLTESMGQPASPDTNPYITDINNDGREDLVALADFGRLYAWDILSGGRHLSLPTTGMSYPVISDFIGNSQKELIALTGDGLQCWTIHFTEREIREEIENDAVPDNESQNEM